MFEGSGRSVIVGSVAVLALGAAWLGVRRPDRAPVAPIAPPAHEAVPPPTDEEDDDGPSYTFRVPSGEPTALGCAEARRIVEQVRAGLAYAPEPVSARALGESTTDWLDPHELWALAADSPVAGAIDKRAPELLAEIEGRTVNGCAGALAVGAALVPWIEELRGTFDEARAEGQREGARARSTGAFLASELVGAGADALRAPLVPAGTTRIVARDLAASIGRRAGALEASLGAAVRPYADAARRRFFPELDGAAWGRVVLAAAVRAYVPLVDPHGAWAPFDEEASVYEVELSARPPERLWQSGDFTAIGFRVKEGAAVPLAQGDVVLAIGDVPVAGLPLEQIDQLGFAAAEARTPTGAVVIREGESAPRTFALGAQEAPSPVAHERDALPTERARYGDGDALVVTIRDVRDDLGDQLARAVRRAREAGDGRALTGVVLDLRGNGGGSTDGAIDALGVFLPGAPLFPMKRRDGTVETDRAPEPPAADRWTGPVAALVDGATASAAEMIAGALAVYRRGPSVGAPTYGKGCAQEYIDDDARAGVLRMTTLLYALPDGSPVQRVGLAPTVRIPFAPAGADREATLAHAAPTWRGPDVRMHLADTAAPAWTPHGGVVGPCQDPDVCRALRALGGSKRVIAAKR